MRLSPCLSLALASGLASAVLAAPAAAAPADVNVGQGGDKFAPPDVTVNVGDAVTWHWVGGTHNVHWTSNPGGVKDSPFQSKRAHAVGRRTLRAHKGLNTISVRRWMHPGRYRVSIVAVDAAGNASQPARLKLTVRR